VGTAERFADGDAGPEELEAAFRAARDAFAEDLLSLQDGPGLYPQGALEAAWFAAHPAARTSAEKAAASAAYGVATVTQDVWDLMAERAAQSDLARDLLGNPFRPATLDPAWLAWKGGAVRSLAVSVYEARDYGRLPILADALEDAGCGSRDILDHCRGPGAHVRGCWVVDLLLGKR
jgi:hypothetical protein